MTRDELAEQNINLVYKVIVDMHLYEKQDEYFDLGLIGLTIAINTFDEKAGYKFSTYAYICIRNEIARYIQKEHRQKREKELYTLSLNKVVTMEHYNKDIEFQDLICDDYDLEDNLIRKEQMELLEQALDKLEYKEIVLLEFLYGLHGMPMLGQKEIGQIFGTSRQVINKRKMRLLKKIRSIIDY